MVARGDVWWYEHPRMRRRPMVILTRDEAIPVLNQVLAAPTTRSIRGIPTEVELGASDGMPASCAVTLDNVVLIRPDLCLEQVTSLGAERMAEVCEALRAAIAC